jgi:ABC-type glycerol-3-phosphate transport system substrate-binding protein
MKYSIRIPFSSLLIAFVLSACGGGSGDAAPRVPVTTHTVTLAWAPNHEKGVNSTGGGYQVTISGQPMITVPYTSGPAAPTSTVTTLQTGTYTATVRAYAALDAQGGSAGSLSAPSQSLTVNVP